MNYPGSRIQAARNEKDLPKCSGRAEKKHYRIWLKGQPLPIPIEAHGVLTPNTFLVFYNGDAIAPVIVATFRMMQVQGWASDEE